MQCHISFILENLIHLPFYLNVLNTIYSADCAYFMYLLNPLHTSLTLTYIAYQILEYTVITASIYWLEMGQRNGYMTRNLGFAFCVMMHYHLCVVS